MNDDRVACGAPPLAVKAAGRSTARWSAGWLAIVVGCAPTTPAVKVASPAPAPAARYEPVLEAGCEHGDQLAFAPGITVEIATCSDAEKHDPNDPDLTTVDRSAMLVLHGRKPEPFELGTWEQGWEWGGSWELLGVLRGDAGNAVISLESGQSEDSRHSRVHVHAVVAGAWREVFAALDADDIDVTIAADDRSASVSYCDGDDTGEACREDPTRLHVAELRWDGQRIIRE